MSANFVCQFWKSKDLSFPKAKVFFKAFLHVQSKEPDYISCCCECKMLHTFNIFQDQASVVSKWALRKWRLEKVCLEWPAHCLKGIMRLRYHTYFTQVKIKKRVLSLPLCHSWNHFHLTQKRRFPVELYPLHWMTPACTPEGLDIEEKMYISLV